ncbi:MAG: tryptophan 2,3-dioxygenase [Actinomycetota bacterium]
MDQGTSGDQPGKEREELSYGRYLRIPELLSLQQPLSQPLAHDEQLFIVVHQSFELWFRLILFELESVRAALFAGQTFPARHFLKRVQAIERMLLDHIGIIESMSPQDFLEFRGNLAPASGFQSVQFREIEFISGLKEPGLMARLAETPEERARLERRLSEPTLWDAFSALMESNGLPMPGGEENVEARRASLLKMMRDKDAYAELFYTAESLLTHDELFTLWRQHHILMVERQIGSKTGTGGTAGVSYLRSTLDKRFYPELWELRSYL